MTVRGAPSQHLVLFADCIPVKGLTRSAIYDLSRHEVHLIPSEYHSLLHWLTSRTLGDVREQLDSVDGDGDAVEQFIDFLLESELAMLTTDPARFPPLPLTWDFPGDIQNAIIDVDQVDHDFSAIVAQLDLLGCQVLQVRGFSPLLTLQRCRMIVDCAKNTSIDGVEIIVHYSPSVATVDYRAFLAAEPLVTSLTVHSVPADVDVPAPRNFEPRDGVRGDLAFTRQVIDSARHCGVITQSYLNAPSISSFTEFRTFNGCLNRKLAVDAEGQIRNCPSMATSFGSVVRQPLDAVVRRDDFRAPWAIGKDDIAVCRECEFRYACSDCRAYLEDPTDQFSKPLKCGYDPATGTWDSWHRPQFKWPVIDGYGITVASPPR